MTLLSVENGRQRGSLKWGYAMNKQNRTQITRVKLRGFKTIKDIGAEGFELRPLNVLIGANGAGKSNFISFFRMLNWAMNNSLGGLQEYIGVQGGDITILSDGPNVTPAMDAEIVMSNIDGEYSYHIKLAHAAGGTLIFAAEEYRLSPHNAAMDPQWESLGTGHKESRIIAAADNSDVARVILNLLRQCKVFQFSNTSFTSNMRGPWTMNDRQQLREDGSNIAPFLAHLRDDHPLNFRNIVETVQLIVPFFEDFVIEPRHDTLLLRWKEYGSEMTFGASQASDGMLRVIALISLLSQPVDDIPDIVILDEPELGLHPYAIAVIAGMIKSVSKSVQILLSTQSSTMVDWFEPEDIIVVDRSGRDSKFRHISTEALGTWLDDYSIAELWEKNVLGGRPR